MILKALLCKKSNINNAMPINHKKMPLTSRKQLHFTSDLPTWTMIDNDMKIISFLPKNDSNKKLNKKELFKLYLRKLGDFDKEH